MEDKKTYRYWLTQRVVTPGAFPIPADNVFLQAVNFRVKELIRGDGLAAYGFVEFAKKLSEEDIAAYELLEEIIVHPTESL